MDLLTCLPNEILWIIASFLPRQRDLFALLITNHSLYSALVGSLYRFDGQYHHGAALSLVVEKNNLTHAQHLLNGLRASFKEEHVPFNSTDSQTEDEDTRCMTRRPDADYWEDVYNHPLYRQGYSVQSILNIQHALVEAVGGGYSDMVRLLLDGGARVNFYRGKRAHSQRARIKSRQWGYVPIDPSPLLMAVKCGHIELVKLLLQRGAKAELYAPSPLCRAVEDNRRDIAAVLVRHGVRPQDTALKLAVLRADQTMVRILLDSGQNAAESGGLALFAAMKRNDRYMVHLLESWGATIARLDDLDKRNWEKEDRDSDDEYGLCRKKLPVSFMQFDLEVDEEEEEEDEEEDEELET
ncbi:ankyrin repeat-containing protein [Aspergillus terreus]|uniref:Ankyrin repeat-containing protein n=1 Tax=Aspergillus terreus TaxID=33178 RepID=A0A5M3YKX1_ASPTE|nr:hypothetical protein ATETN484_0001012400 [Aspergillus terreus]GFF11905.1 ankyrin repeat-containing protein [Aspergillus terreus]